MSNILVILLFCIGLWGVLSGRNVIRKIIGLALLNSSVVVLFILGGRIGGTAAPILTEKITGEIVDPIPQALMLTAIVVGLSITAVALILAVKLYHVCGTLDIKEIERSSDESSH
ncbi:MAG: cation:proton antiporter subunit C [Spirochaetia bacterium]